MLNVLTKRERQVLEILSTDGEFRTAVIRLYEKTRDQIDVQQDLLVDGPKALTAGHAEGPGYVSLAFAGEQACGSNPVSIAILRVTDELYRGEIDVFPSDSLFDEQLTLRHSGDFAGQADDYVFEWRTFPDTTTRPTVDQWARFPTFPASGEGAIDALISGPGIQTLSDNWFVARYCNKQKHTCDENDEHWSAWTEEQLAEGWIKRVLADLNPFEQRMKSFEQTKVNTLISMIAQAGPKWEGDIALTSDPDHLNKIGLIEAYETVFRRGVNLSIEGTPPVGDYEPANNALLLVSSRIADLYTLLGNEAFGDATDPTIAFGTDHGEYGNIATKVWAFQNQTASLIEEELALLRGT